MAQPLTEQAPELVVAAYEIKVDRTPVQIDEWDVMALDMLENYLSLAESPTAHRALSAIRYLRNGLDNQRVRSALLEEQRDAAQKAKRSVEQDVALERRNERDAVKFINQLRTLMHEGEWL